MKYILCPMVYLEGNCYFFVVKGSFLPCQSYVFICVVDVIVVKGSFLPRQSWVVLYLESLDISGCSKVTSVGLSNLTHLPLQELEIACCCFTDEEMVVISQLCLRKLYMNRNLAVTDTGMSELTALKRLEFLDISGCCFNVTSVGLANLTHLPLQVLNIVWCKSYQTGCQW